MQTWILFALGAVLSWGAYGPALGAGRAGFDDPKTASLRALLCVGLAYFLVAVLFPVVMLWAQGKLEGFNLRGGGLMSTLSGILGAAGAICIILAIGNGGTPFLVMPIVFGGAPLVNALITLAPHPETLKSQSPYLYVGFVLSAVGAALVLGNLPHGAPPASTAGH
jgi:hypothetical protein